MLGYGELSKLQLIRDGCCCRLAFDWLPGPDNYLMVASHLEYDPARLGNSEYSEEGGVDRYTI